MLDVSSNNVYIKILLTYIFIIVLFYYIIK